jgi:hypothetical protein
MRVKYRILLGDCYNKETKTMAVYAAVGRNTCKLYQVMAATHGNEYKLIEIDFWAKTTKTYFCDTVIGAKALIEQFERHEEADDYDWEADETDYYWATR